MLKVELFALITPKFPSVCPTVKSSVVFTKVPAPVLRLATGAPAFPTWSEPTLSVALGPIVLLPSPKTMLCSAPPCRALLKFSPPRSVSVPAPGNISTRLPKVLAVPVPLIVALALKRMKEPPRVTLLFSVIEPVVRGTATSTITGPKNVGCVLVEL